jgi:hypothetical protein
VQIVESFKGLPQPAGDPGRFGRLRRVRERSALDEFHPIAWRSFLAADLTAVTRESNDFDEIRMTEFDEERDLVLPKGQH